MAGAWVGGRDERRRVMTEQELQFETRFRRVSSRYPRRVSEAYFSDHEAAMRDTDERVAATVAAWERALGWPVNAWPAIGRKERGE